MMMSRLLIALTENDKRILVAILLVIILVFVLIGYIGMLITRIMKWQGKRMDNLVHDVVVTKVITNRKHFLKYGRKKNWRLYFKQAWIPIIIMLVGSLILIIRNAVARDFSYDVFNYKKTGFGTLLFIWNFGDPDSYTEIFGLKVLAKWPPLINTPHFELKAWASYLFMPCMIVGGGWYLVTLQALIARTLRLYKLSRSVFDKSLEGYNQNRPQVDVNQTSNTTSGEQK